MTEKFDPYDVLVAFIPGVLLTVWVSVCLKGVFGLQPVFAFPAAFQVVALLAVSVVAGNLVQALASLLEPVLHVTWGGRPSRKALRSGLGLALGKDSVERIRKTLRRKAGEEASSDSLFLYAMRHAREATAGHCERFNMLYAYHRSLFFSACFAIAVYLWSWRFGTVESWPPNQRIAVMAVLLLSALLLWHRAKRRAFYYVREVLLAAERVIEAESGEHEAMKGDNNV